MLAQFFGRVPGGLGGRGLAAARYRVILIAVSVPIWLPVLAARAAWPAVAQLFRRMPGGLGSRGLAAAPFRVLVIAGSVSILLPVLAARATGSVVARLFSGMPGGLGSRGFASALISRVSLVTVVVMAVIAVQDIAGGWSGLNFAAVVAIGTGAFGVFFLILVQGTRSGNIRRAERAADLLDQDRA